MICRRTKTPSIAPMTLFVVPCLLFSRSKAYVSRIPRNFQSLSTTQLLFHVDFFHQRNYNNVYDRNDFMKQKNSKFNFLFSQSSSSSSLSSSPDSVTYTTTSSDFAIDPHSEYARQITSSMGFTTNQHSNLVKLASLVVERNEQINLISRKDCNEAVVFGRHILPSVSLASLLSDTDEKIIDVGTGGGFPGLPLAILFPEREFLLVDSVRKKVDVVQAMADELGLDNLSTHYGRAEEMEISNDKDKFDIVLGRSVAALPKFCFWVQDLVASKSRKGKLIYIIGGEVEEIVTRRCSAEIPLNDLVEIEEGASMSDKRALILGADELKLIASESGEKKVNRGKPKKKNQKKNKFQEAKGSWSKKDDKTPKNRGYENFKRYES